MNLVVYKGEIVYEDDGWEIIVYESKAVKDRLLKNDRECLLDALEAMGHDAARLDKFNIQQLEQICISRGMYVQMID
jgi:hypothetical protein